MKILIVNAILYTNENKKVRTCNSVQDCMIIDLCKAFAENGHDVTLVAAEEYKPLTDESFNFRVIWMKSYFRGIFPANKIPFNFGLLNHLRHNSYDYIICSEVFSLDSLLAVMLQKNKIIIWQEMAFHQKLAKKLASKFWHNVIVRLFFGNVRVVPRTENAKKFISLYCNNVSSTVIQHGINLNKFVFCSKKSKFFMISSQLIPRKRIDKIIYAYSDFCNKYGNDYKLYIAGDGDEKTKLVDLVNRLKLNDHVVFLNKLPHSSLVKYLSEAIALLIYTEKDNSMISISEAIAVGTPIVTTSVPDNSVYIRDNSLGIVSDCWGADDLIKVVRNNSKYVDNCNKYRATLDNNFNVNLFIDEFMKLQSNP